MQKAQSGFLIAIIGVGEDLRAANTDRETPRETWTMPNECERKRSSAGTISSRTGGSSPTGRRRNGSTRISIRHSDFEAPREAAGRVLCLVRVK